MRIGVLLTAQELWRSFYGVKRGLAKQKIKRFFTGPPRTLNMLMCYLWGCDTVQHLPDILLAELFLQENYKYFNMHLIESDS